MSASIASPSQVRNVAIDAPEDYGTVYNVMHEPDCDTYCEAWDRGDGCDEMVRWWLTLPDSDSTSNLVGICERHFRRDFEPVSKHERSTDMSWSVNSYYLKADENGIDGKAGIQRDQLQKLGGLIQPPASTDEVKDQVVAAIKVAEALMDSGAVGPGPYGVALSGHANPGHTPTAGYSNDTVTASVSDMRQAKA